MKKYAAPQAFLAGLEATLRKRAGTAPLAFERRRQTLAFDRLLVRLAQHFGDRVLLTTLLIAPWDSVSRPRQRPALSIGRF